MHSGPASGWAPSIPLPGYLRLMIDGTHQYVHRIVWMYAHGRLPRGDLDHIDGDKTNCAISNLRPASKAQNNSNRRVARKTIGPRGYWLNPKAGMFQVNIGVGGRSVYLGAYRFPEAAEKAYREAAEELHGAFAFTSRPRPSLSCGGLRDGPAARKTGAGARTAAPGASRDRRHTCARSR